MNLYDAVPPETDYSTSFMDQNSGDYGDMVCHITPPLELAEYYASPTSLRKVQSIASSVSIGEVVCVYTRLQSTRTCGTVYITRVSSSTYRRMVAMENHSTVGGDSGGP